MDVHHQSAGPDLWAALGDTQTALFGLLRTLSSGDLEALETLGDGCELLASRLAALTSQLVGGDGPDGEHTAELTTLLALAELHGRAWLLLHQCRETANEEWDLVLRLLALQAGYQDGGQAPLPTLAGHQFDQRA